MLIGYLNLTTGKLELLPKEKRMPERSEVEQAIIDSTHMDVVNVWFDEHDGKFFAKYTEDEGTVQSGDTLLEALQMAYLSKSQFPVASFTLDSDEAVERAMGHTNERIIGDMVNEAFENGEEDAS